MKITKRELKQMVQQLVEESKDSQMTLQDFIKKYGVPRTDGELDNVDMNASTAEKFMQSLVDSKVLSEYEVVEDWTGNRDFIGLINGSEVMNFTLGGSGIIERELLDNIKE